MRLVVAPLLLAPSAIVACGSFAASDPIVPADDAGGADAPVQLDATPPDAAASGDDGGGAGCTTFLAASPDWREVKSGLDAQIEYGIDHGDRFAMRAHASGASSAALVRGLATGEVAVRVTARIKKASAPLGALPKFIEIACDTPAVSTFVALDKEDIALGTSDGLASDGLAPISPPVFDAWTTFELHIKDKSVILRVGNAPPITAQAQTSFTGAVACKLSIGVENGKLNVLGVPRLEASFQDVCFLH